MAFQHVTNNKMKPLQLIQNKAIRVELRLPSYLAIPVLHEYAALPMIRQRLNEQSKGLLQKMIANNDHIRDLVINRVIINQSHHSPLDSILPA